ncbi:MAG: rhodanese-like domain-containing protein [Cellvibrionales bacterium]|jgi:rhodanese-related sulfurtransferase|nr:rhodanese-like domain-containing protein [Cellvibrionales bacterium]MBK8676499.1 rhodanese-like domain-containing protein [Cellvibrionales bacterium]HRF87006.1 rhodanese-like domain-containing protein [Pseudomonadales bacterium]HRG49847.1 rhodanese-like domain-containing protein [Pseudomonadales bacterium]
MTQFLIFLGQQWMLVSLLLALLGFFMWNENRRAGSSLSVHQLTHQVNNANALVVDLREPKEFREGHVVDALNIPYAKLAERMADLDKTRPLVLVDKMGQHSAAAGRTLMQAGYQVSRLNGGMSEWTASNLPVVKGG